MVNNLVKVKEDMTGWIMSEHGVPNSRLKVLKQIEDYVYPSGIRTSQWLCECLCEEHNIISVIGKSIRSGNTKSCGCLECETKCMTKNKKYNTYDLSGEYGIGYTSNGEEFWFDKEDYDLIKKYCWHMHHGYIETTDKDTIISMHRLVMHVTNEDVEVDHKKHNKFDNRKSELRIATHSQNMQNCSLYANNISGVKGVIWHKRDCVWEVQININGERKYLGRYVDFNEAVKVRKEAEEKYFDEFSYDKSMASDKAGSKLTKAQQLGVRVAGEDELMKMLD